MTRLFQAAAGCEAPELRERVSVDARESFSFFARRVLGHRRLSQARCAELEAGAEAKLKLEAKALRLWRALRSGDASELPPFTRFVVGNELSA
jgi:hypothetical protein